ncbi:NYN domain-containing protein [Corynebacterium cystitidis]|uniref:NYN domain-containing protein n=1 Tax=Corynebacterium cystitidis TaxID=35757 RepID=UPI001E6444E8|nr:NYN domain-containing protein [Corynebacterium cystitidis]
MTRQQVNLRQTDTYAWTNEFFSELTKKRKVALRRGEQLESQNEYQLKSTPLKKLLNPESGFSLEDLRESDFTLDIVQKGVDMRLGLDIATLAERGIVNQIVMIAGDSDFVPAAKHARREGIDFILDPMWNPITPSLSEHVDGIRQCVVKPPNNKTDPLHVEHEDTEALDHSVEIPEQVEFDEEEL